MKISRKCYEELTNEKLIEEIRWRSNRSTLMVGAADCTVHAEVKKVCYEILRERGCDWKKEG